MFKFDQATPTMLFRRSSNGSIRSFSVITTSDDELRVFIFGGRVLAGPNKLLATSFSLASYSFKYAVNIDQNPSAGNFAPVSSYALKALIFSTSTEDTMV